MGRPARSNMRPRTALPTGTEIGGARAPRLEAAREALGLLHGDAAGDPVAHVQHALRQDRAVLGLDLDRVEDPRHHTALEPQVEDGPRHPHDRSNAFAHARPSFIFQGRGPGAAAFTSAR